MSTMTLHYDAAENIAYVSFDSIRLSTPTQLVSHFDKVVALWKRECGGNKAYYVVDYTGFTVDVGLTELYAEQLKRVAECAITVVRYGGDSMQRTAVRLANMKLHVPSQLYESKEQALEVVRALKGGTMQLGKAAAR